MSAQSPPARRKSSPLRSLPSPSPIHKKALALAREARTRKMTSEDIREQEVSFVFGNLPASSPLSKDDVRRMIREHRGET